MEEAGAVFGSQGVTPAQVEKLRKIAETSEFGIRMRIYYYLSRLTRGQISEELGNQCFRYICDSLYEASIGTLQRMKSIILPVRRSRWSFRSG